MNDTMKTARPLPTAEELRALLDYDPASGIFRWRMKPARQVRVGDVAGGLNPDGYTLIKIDGRSHMAHRLAYLWVHGAWPQHQIDHRDGRRSNNSLANLREATQNANMHNRAKQSRPTSSRYLGVYLDKNTGRWRAHIRHNGKQHRLGRFDTQELAYAAYLAAKSVFHPAQPVPRDSAYSHRDIAIGA